MVPVFFFFLQHYIIFDLLIFLQILFDMRKNMVRYGSYCQHFTDDVTKAQRGYVLVRVEVSL